MARKRTYSVNRRKANGFFFLGISVLLLVAVVGGIFGAAVFNGVRQASLSRRKDLVLRIGAKDVVREQFELFCIMVIEGEEFEKLVTNTASENALATAVKQKAAEYAQEYFALKSEAEEQEITLTPLEMAEVDLKVSDIPKGVNADDYYRKNYGVSEQGYRDFLYGWKLCEKYVNQTAANVEVDESTKREIFDRNASKLGWGFADVIYFNTNIPDSGTIALKRSTAQNICDTVNDAAEKDKESVFKSFYDAYNEPGFSSSGINVAIAGEVASSWPGLFDAIKRAATGYCYVVEDTGAVFAVRVRERYMFETYKDSEELAVLVMSDVRRNVAERVIKGGKYNIAYMAAMDSVDVKPLIAARKAME
ncbi:MAG: hypothetical protein IJS71_09575 [Clostridia bacterium]|nr:hypothetical protein [Clostridia bacterium]